MTIPDEEMARHCRAVFGEELDPATRASLAAQAAILDASNRTLLGRLQPESEPGGYASLLRRMPRGR